MASQIDLGAVVPIGKGDWNASTTYERTNIVRHNSTAWICKVATSTGVEPTESSSDWYLLVKDTSSVTSVNGMIGDVVVDTSTADKLTTARKITLTGPITGTVDFDGSANVSIPTTVVSASISVKGVVQLNDTVTSTSTTQAATANAVKQAYDKAVEADNNAGIIRLFNSRIVITESNADWTPPVTGWARVTVIGGGGAGGSNGNRGGRAGGNTSFGNYLTALGGPGGGGTSRTTYTCGGAGGGAGNVESAYVYLKFSTAIKCIIGAGGTISTTDNTAATGTGAPDFVPNSATSKYSYKSAMSGGRYPGGNGAVGNIDNSGCSGLGGSGGSNGTAFGGGGGGCVSGTYMIWASPGVGSGNGSSGVKYTSNGVNQYNGGNGGPGAIIVEYYDPEKEEA